MTATAAEIVEELKGLGSPSIKKVLVKHGAQEPFFGVKVADIKKIQKRIKTDHALALALYDTGISDAMYLAGLIADDARMTKKDLQRWVDAAPWSMISESTVPWVTAGSPHARELALKWIESKKETVAAAGWSTLSSWVSITDDAELDLDELKKLLKRAAETVHQQPNRVRQMINGFVIAVGAYVKPLTTAALAAAEQMGVVTVEMGDTACETPLATEYIQKIVDRGTVGKKRKSAKC
jgi:3-methyladenine DNA glycosylase AlkD